MLRMQTVLIPTDFSESADQALRVARTLAKDHGAKLVLVSVPPIVPPVSELFYADSNYDGVVAGVRLKLENLANTITEIPVETRTIAGEIGPTIVALAHEYNADMVVMGTHGRKGVTRLLMGSVAEYVTRHAPCPVLTMRPRVGDRYFEQEETATTFTDQKAEVGELVPAMA